jgi:hypothetical protein
MKSFCVPATSVSAARLIGIVQGDGSVAFLGQPLTIDRQFVDVAAQGRPAELRFRFASPCAKSGCANWSGCGCGIATSITQSIAAAASELPNCGIRPQCRWFREHGARACAVCPEIVRGAEDVRARAPGPAETNCHPRADLAP